MSFEANIQAVSWGGRDLLAEIAALQAENAALRARAEAAEAAFRELRGASVFAVDDDELTFREPIT